MRKTRLTQFERALWRHLSEHPGPVPPTLREIADELEVASTSHVWYAIENLRRAGIVEVIPNKSRSRIVRIPFSSQSAAELDQEIDDWDSLPF